MIIHDLKDGILTIKLQGEIDHDNAPRLKIAADSLINRGNFSSCIFDLSNVTFMDSTAVGLILGRYKLLKQAGVAVYFYKPSREADKVLKVSGLYTIINKI